MQRAYNLKRVHRLEHCLQGVLDCVKRMDAPHYTDETPTLASVLLAERTVITQLTDEALAIVERGHDSDPADQRTQVVRDSGEVPELWEVVWLSGTFITCTDGQRPPIGPHVTHSVGYLVADLPDALTLASLVEERPVGYEGSGVLFCIPTCAVRSRRRLTVAE